VITKDNLIAMLEKASTNEDEFIIEYGKDFLQQLQESSELENSEKEEIAMILGALLEDTQRHKEIIEELIEKIKEGQKNEF